MVASAGLGVRVVVVADELVVAHADGHLFAEAPVKHVVRGAGLLAAQEGQEVYPVEFPLRLHVHACDGQSRGRGVELDHGWIEHTGLQAAGPGDEERHADAAFERGALGTAKRMVARSVHRRAGHGGAAVVADEENEGVLLEAGVGELLAHAADGFVHRQHHGGVGAALLVGDVGELRQSVVGGLHRRVDGVEGEIEKPGSRLVALDERHRLAPEGIGGVVQFVHLLVAAQDAGLVHVAVRAAEKTIELVEAALGRAHGRFGAKVPFANDAGGVAGGFEALGDGRFGQRHSLRAGGIELVSEAVLVAAREQGGARRRAIRPGHVAAGEADARRGEGVEVRRGDVLAAMKAHVRVAHVIADDEEDVGFGGQVLSPGEMTTWNVKRCQEEEGGSHYL